MEHSDSEGSKKSESSDSEYSSDEEQKPKNEPEAPEDKEGSLVDKEAPAIKRKPKPTNQVEVKEDVKSNLPVSENVDLTPTKDGASPEPEKDFGEKANPLLHPTKDKLTGKDETVSPTVHLGLISDSENKLVIDLGEDPSGQEAQKTKHNKKTQTKIKKQNKQTKRKNKNRKESKVLSHKQDATFHFGRQPASPRVDGTHPLSHTSTCSWGYRGSHQQHDVYHHSHRAGFCLHRKPSEEAEIALTEGDCPSCAAGHVECTNCSGEGDQLIHIHYRAGDQLVTSTPPAGLVSSWGFASTLASGINANLLHIVTC